MEWIGRAWRGQERLWRVYWLYGVLGGFGLGILAFFLSLTLGPKLLIPLSLFFILYTIWLWVAEWRCAMNAAWVFWGYVVRVVIVLKLLFLPTSLIGGVIVGQDLAKAAQCRKEALAYAAHGGTDAAAFEKSCRLKQSHGATPFSDAFPLPPVDYRQQCVKNMTDYALGQGADPQVYMAQNQSYLQKCIQYYTTKNMQAP